MLSLDKTDRVIINLKVLATLKEGERVCVRNGQFSLYSIGWGQSLTRWFYKENRWLNFEDVQNVFNEAICILNTYMNMAVQVDNNAPHAPPNAPLTAVDNVARELTSAMNGLVQLRKTYCDDPLMVATLDVLIERAQTEVSKALNLLQTYKYCKPALVAPAAEVALPVAPPVLTPTPSLPASLPAALPVAPQVITVQPSRSREVVAKQ